LTNQLCIHFPTVDARREFSDKLERENIFMSYFDKFLPQYQQNNTGQTPYIPIEGSQCIYFPMYDYNGKDAVNFVSKKNVNCFLDLLGQENLICDHPIGKQHLTFTLKDSNQELLQYNASDGNRNNRALISFTSSIFKDKKSCLAVIKPRDEEQMRVVFSEEVPSSILKEYQETKDKVQLKLDQEKQLKITQKKQEPTFAIKKSNTCFSMRKLTTFGIVSGIVLSLYGGSECIANKTFKMSDINSILLIAGVAIIATSLILRKVFQRNNVSATESVMRQTLTQAVI
jgi:hypothetical protein